MEPQHPSYRQADPHVWFAAAGATQRGGFRGHREAADRVRLCREPWSGHLGLTASMWAWPWLLSLRRGGGTEVGRAEQVVRRVPYQRVLRDLEPGDVYQHVRVQQAPSRVVRPVVRATTTDATGASSLPLTRVPAVLRRSRDATG